MHFHEQADSFDLSVSLADSKLSLTLKDFVDWAIYGKDYTDADVGKEIHKKMDPSDVYSAFSRTQAQDGEGDTKTTKADLKEYKFGTVVEREKLPCYKIEKGGKVSVFMTMVDKYSKKEVTYETKLVLAKVRNMAEAEISAEKSARQRDTQQSLNQTSRKLIEQLT